MAQKVGQQIYVLPRGLHYIYNGFILHQVWPERAGTDAYDLVGIPCLSSMGIFNCDCKNCNGPKFFAWYDLSPLSCEHTNSQEVSVCVHPACGKNMIDVNQLKAFKERQSLVGVVWTGDSWGDNSNQPLYIQETANGELVDLGSPVRFPYLRHKGRPWEALVGSADRLVQKQFPHYKGPIVLDPTGQPCYLRMGLIRCTCHCCRDDL